MPNDMKEQVKLFMIFDILGDTERTGPVIWQIKRKRLEDIKDHILDLILMARILRNYLPDFINFDKLYDYIICHDLPEAITGDITAFEGITKEEKEKVTNVAIEYLQQRFGHVMDLKKIIMGYEERIDIEAKITKILDKISSFFAFLKYQSEQNVDMNNPHIIPSLRYHPYVDQKIKEGKDIGDIFFEFHMHDINISDKECEKYQLSRKDADKILEVIRAFANELYIQKLKGTLLDVKETFPSEGMKYNKGMWGLYGNI